MSERLGANRRPSRSLVRRLFFPPVLVLIVVSLIEFLCVPAFVLITDGEPFGVSDWRANRLRPLLGEGSESIVNRRESEILHPYVGYVMRPDDPGTRVAGRQPVSEYGLLDDKLPLVEPRSDRFVVLLTGGSVAFYVSTEGEAALRQELARVPALAEAEIIFVRAALGGFKQPQQLLMLNFLLSLGAHFDAVINLDGFNEIVLPMAENLPNEVFPHFPRNWHIRVADLSRQKIVLLSRAETHRIARIENGERFDRPVMRHSHALAIVEEMLDRWLQASQAEIQSEMSEVQARSSEARGPSAESLPGSDTYAGIARHWAESSILMHQVCAARGIRYWHFLQPNQYVAGAKPMNGEEQVIAIAPRSAYRTHATAGYGALISEGRRIEARSVRYTDLTGLFQEHPEPLYEDTCCHLNKLGNELVAHAIGRKLAADLIAENEVPR